VQRLDRHLPLQMRITREINDALRTSTQFADDLETPNVLAHGTGRRGFLCPAQRFRLAVGRDELGRQQEQTL
jgi:hypothetical protein